MKPLRNVLACLWLLTMPAGATLAPDSDVDPAATLRESYARLRDALAHSPFGEPMTLESSDVGALLRGQVHALIDRP